MTARRRVVVIDDHPLLAAGLGVELVRHGMMVDIADPAPPGELIAALGPPMPQCAVLDLGLPTPGGGLVLIEPLVAVDVDVAVLTGETDPALWAACAEAGAAVVLSKSEPLDEIVDVVRRLCDGERVRPQQRLMLLAERQRQLHQEAERVARFDSLSPREQEVLAGLMAGIGPAELAARDFVSVQTIRTQIKSVLRKLACRSQLEAVAAAHASNWHPSG